MSDSAWGKDRGNGIYSCPGQGWIKAGKIINKFGEKTVIILVRISIGKKAGQNSFVSRGQTKNAK